MPQTPDQLIHTALDHHRAGRLEQAEQIYRQILTINPNHADALHLLGVVAFQTDHHRDAIALIEQAIRINPRAPDYQSNLADVYVALGQLDAAVTHYRNAIAANPRSLHAYNNLGMTLVNLNRLDDAIAVYRTALNVDPNDTHTHNNLGIALFAQGHTDDALRSFEQALKLDPRNHEPHTNIGWALQIVHQHEAAIAAFQKAIAIEPRHSIAHLNLGMSYLAQGRVDEAFASLRTASELRPTDRGPRSNMLLAMHYDTRFSPVEVFEAHRRWSDGLQVPARPPIDATEHRIRVGYVSPDFRAHSVAFFIEPVLQAHDRTAVEVFCYSIVRKPDDTTRRIASHAQHFVDAASLTDAQLADRIRADRIDILIDLAGHTACNRLLVFARQPAPIQATYLGYPDTTGLPAMQFRIVDSVSDPAGDEFHTEELIRLPRCAWCYRPADDSPPVNELPARSGNRITFGSFNTLPKLSTATLDLWSRILAAVSNSCLVIKAPPLRDESTKERITRAFAARNVPADRLRFRTRDNSLSDHFKSYHEIDIALDTFPYHGTTTTCDALWMGVPVVTLAGNTHVSRVGVSLLNAVGLPELVADSPEQYVSVAVELAADLPRLASLRASMRDRMSRSPLMDARSLAAALEAAFRDMLGAKNELPIHGWTGS